MKKFLCSVLVAVLALSLGTCAWSADYWDEHVDGIVAHMTGGSIEDCTSKATIEE